MDRFARFTVVIDPASALDIRTNCAGSLFFDSRSDRLRVYISLFQVQCSNVCSTLVRFLPFAMRLTQICDAANLDQP